MATFLALDFGEARTGVALGESETQIVSPISTLVRRSDEQLIEEILVLVQKHQAEQLILGLPSRLDGSEGDAALRVRSFHKKLETRTRLPATLVTETLTSRAARERIATNFPGQRSKKRASRRVPANRQVDAVAAQLIGEQYLEQSREGVS